MSDPAALRSVPVPVPPAPEGGGHARRFARALLRGLRSWGADECGQHAAAIAYYALLAFFPFFILLASVASLVVGEDAQGIRQALAPLRPLIPELGPGFWDRVQGLIEARGVLSAFSLFFLVVIATRLTVSVERALVAIFHASGGRPKKRKWLRWLVAHAMTVAAIVALGVLLTTVALLEVMLHAKGAPDWLREVGESALVTRHALPLGILTGLGYALFSLLPQVRVAPRWRLTGAVFFAVTHDAAVSLWARFTGALIPRDVVYGSFLGAVSLATWTWVAASLLLVSAELVAQLNGNRTG